MKKYIKNIAIFLVLFPIVYAFIIFIYGLTMPAVFRKNMPYGSVKGFLYTRLQETETYGKADVVVVGSSHAYRGFDPRIFESRGIKMFNLGSSAQTPVQTEILLHRHLDKLDPDLVIFEVYPAVFQNSGIQPAIDLISNDKIDLEIVQMVMETGNIRVFNTLIYGLIRQWFGMDQHESKTNKRDTYISGGYVEREMETFVESNAYEPLSWEFDIIQVKSFERILENLRHNQIDYLLVEAPISERLFHAYQNSDVVDQYFQTLDPGFINYNRIELLDDQYFYSETHLNQNGVERFNNILLDTLINRGIPQNRRIY